MEDGRWILFLIAIVCTITVTLGYGDTVNSMLYMPENRISEPNPGMLLPSPYDKYGSPPDHYPAIIPGPVIPSDYYDNITYPGIFDSTAECHTVRNCPWEFPGAPADPYSSLWQGAAGFLGVPHRPTSGPDGWKCSVEADCFDQDQIPTNLSNETEVLFLRSYTFRSIEPGNLSVLPPLVKLRIEYSDLQTIQRGAFTSQTTLEVLELEGNDLTYIFPSTFEELKNLKTLDITNNDLSHLNQEMFFGLDKLEHLSLGSNSIVGLPGHVFSHLTTLEELFLEDNNISFVAPNAFSGLPNLKSIYLNHNYITRVPTEALKLLPSLTDLQLSGNPILNIARLDFRGLDHLSTVWLDDCGMETIAKRAFNNKKFKTLVLSDNNLRTLPNLGAMPRLRTIRLDNNPWVCDCKMWPVLKWLRRHGFNSPKPDPECRSPPRLLGRKSLDLVQDDLCSGSENLSNLATQSPDATSFTQPSSSETHRKDPQNTRTESGIAIAGGASNAYDYSPGTYYDGETYSEKGPLLPSGGWSNVPYDTKKLYFVEGEHTPSQAPLQPYPTEGYRTSPAHHSDLGITLLTRLSTLRSTSALRSLQTTTGTPKFESTARILDHATQSAPETNTGKTTPPADVFNTKSHGGSDTADTGMSSLVYIVIAVAVAATIGVCMMVAVAKVVVYKRHTGKLKTNDLKLKLSADGAVGERSGDELPTKTDNNSQNGHVSRNL